MVTGHVINWRQHMIDNEGLNGYWSCDQLEATYTNLWKYSFNETLGHVFLLVSWYMEFHSIE